MAGHLWMVVNMENGSSHSNYMIARMRHTALQKIVGETSSLTICVSTANIGRNLPAHDVRYAWLTAVFYYVG